MTSAQLAFYSSLALLVALVALVTVWTMLLDARTSRDRWQEAYNRLATSPHDGALIEELQHGSLTLTPDGGHYWVMIRKGVRVSGRSIRNLYAALLTSEYAQELADRGDLGSLSGAPGGNSA